MTVIELMVELEVDSRKPAPAVRAFVDVGLHEGLGSEQALALLRDGSRWVGRIVIPGRCTQPMLYRIEIAAPRRTRWSYRIGERGFAAAWVCDADCTEDSKVWLVGSVEPAYKLLKRGDAGALRLRDPVRADPCHLRLVPRACPPAL